MTKLAILELLFDKTAVDHPAWEAFVRQMRTKDYGREPLNQAWYFFKEGWEAEERNG